MYIAVRALDPRAIAISGPILRARRATLRPVMTPPTAAPTPIPFEVIKVSPLEVELDRSNPRLRSEERQLDEPALLEVMMGRFRLEDLGRSIAARGFLNYDPIFCFRVGGGKET